MEVRDAFGNLVTSSAASITIAIGTNPSAGILNGTLTTNATSGVASFTDLSINVAGTGYTLAVSSTGLTGATSSAFDITAPAAPSITSLSPTSGPVGTSVIINGSNFGVPQGTSDVTFNGVAAAPTSWSDTLISAPVPSGATTGPVVVTVSGVASNAVSFTVTGSGTISGTVVRVSDGTAIVGAAVEAFEGTVLQGTTTTSSSGSYSIPGLAEGTYTVRASASGFVPQIQTGVMVVAGATVTVNLSLNPGIAIHSPVAGAVINDHSVLVTGQFDTFLASEVGITVNGYVALQDGNEFSTFVPVDAQTTSLTATVANTAGVSLGSHTIPITTQPPTSEPILLFRPSPSIGLVAQPVTFTLTSLNEIAQIELDTNGDGTIDFTGTTLEGQAITFTEPGVYFPTVKVTEPSGAVEIASALVQILDMNQLDVFLQSKWNEMKDALRSGNTALAASYVVISKRTNYQNVFNALTIPFANIDQVLTNITYVGQRGLNVEYEMIRAEEADQVSYMVLFVLDEDGIWRIKGF